MMTMLPAQAADQKPLKVASDVPYEPFEMQRPDGTFTGFEVDLVNAICEQMQRRCEWVKQGWDGIIPGLQARKYDFIASAMSVTPDRRKQVLFADPYYAVPSLWVAPDDSDIDDVSGDLAGKKIGVQRATVQDNYVTQHYPKAEIRRYATADDLATDMSAGRLDLTFITGPLAQDVLINRGNFRQLGEPVSKPKSIFGDGIAAAFRPRDRALVEQFNQALHKVEQNGTYDRLMHQYFDYDIHPDTTQ
ncbi:nickel transporter [Kushneria phosphatilytica]|uniref:Transporter substrate-binding domain-containing protein n=2 Tax=Kushneria phosphatilytica TaxID=657387 RepID=A0A1S1NT12_9GAMM|nr:nickel transporter [Kushneria phosphatilytica]QEL12656.1 transporter substrate-binding domain-containing protein [Kushneria phosphatilytica]